MKKVPPPGKGIAAPEGHAEEVPRPDVYLLSERIFASAEPKIVMTILGSCVSICLWDQLRAAGGINHFLLPYHPNESLGGARYGNVAFKLLLEKMESLGCRKRDLVGKVFGGATIVLNGNGREFHLGQKNADQAFAMLESERIPVVSSDVGGSYGRKLIFSTAFGTVWVRMLGETSDGAR